MFSHQHASGRGREAGFSASLSLRLQVLRQARQSLSVVELSFGSWLRPVPLPAHTWSVERQDPGKLGGWMRPRGRRVHGEAVERPSFLLLFHSQISGAGMWLPLRGSHRDTLWPKWAQHLCTPGQPGPTVLLLLLSAGWQHILGSSDVAFAGRDWFMRPPKWVGPMSTTRAVAWEYQAAQAQYWLHPCCVTLVKDLTSPSPSFPTRRSRS